MKSLFTFIASLFLSVALFANPFPTRLTITNFVNSDLRIVVDGNKYDGIGNTLSLNNLSTGYHNIKVYEVRRGFWSNNRLIYSSSVFFKPNYQVNVLISRRGDVSVAEQRMGGRFDRDNGYGYGRNDDHDNRRDGGYNNGRNDGGWDDHGASGNNRNPDYGKGSRSRGY